MSEELKPCVCGGAPTRKSLSNNWSFWVECSECANETARKDSPEVADAAWRSGDYSGGSLRATPSPGPASDADERAAFDAWFAEGKFGGMKESMWAAWQGRAASTRTASDTRTAALEEAAKLCDKWADDDMPGAVKGRSIRLAEAIRALATGEAECDAALRPAPEGQHDAERVAELEAENDQLREALADKVSAATLLKKFSMEGNALEMTFEGGACHFLADSLGKQFRDMKGDNYIEMGFTCSDGLNLLVTMQRTNGKTPAQLKAEAERKLAECEARLAESEASRGGAQGRITQAETRMDTGSCGGAQVDVEAERKLFEAWFVSENGPYGKRSNPNWLRRNQDKSYAESETDRRWQGWLAARTQADAGKAPTTTKPENT